MSIIYIVFVDASRKGSYMTHVDGFIKGIQQLGLRINVYSLGLRIGEDQKRKKFLKFLPKILGYTILDILIALQILFRSKKHVYILRPYRYTILIYLAVYIRKVKLIQENNGILVNELVLNGRNFESRIYLLLETLFKNIPNLHVCVSSGISKYYEKLSLKGNIVTVPNGIDLERVYSRIQPLNYKNGLKLLFIGKLTPWQGLREFIKFLKSNLPSFQISLTIIGEGEETEVVKELLNTSAIEYRIIEWSNWKQICKISEDCNLGIIPRKNQNIAGSPLKMMDYISLGLPVLTTRCDGIKDILDATPLYIPFDYEKKDSLENAYHLLKKTNTAELLSYKNLILKTNTWEEHARKIIQKIQAEI